MKNISMCEVFNCLGSKVFLAVLMKRGTLMCEIFNCFCSEVLSLSSRGEAFKCVRFTTVPVLHFYRPSSGEELQCGRFPTVLILRLFSGPH